MFFIRCMRYFLSHLQYTANMSVLTPSSQKLHRATSFEAEIASRGLFSVENGDEKPQSLTVEISYKYNIGNHFQSYRSLKAFANSPLY